jgi:hypothetical protein
MISRIRYLATPFKSRHLELVSKVASQPDWQDARRDEENERKNRKVYPLRYTQGFLAKFDEVAAHIW